MPERKHKAAEPSDEAVLEDQQTIASSVLDTAAVEDAATTGMQGRRLRRRRSHDEHRAKRPREDVDAPRGGPASRPQQLGQEQSEQPESEQPESEQPEPELPERKREQSDKSKTKQPKQLPGEPSSPPPPSIIEAPDPNDSPPIEAEHPDPEHPVDEGYVSDTASFAPTASLASSVRDYEFENSRRYHKFRAGLYQFPNDLPEQEREDMKHTVAVHLLGGRLYSAPLQNPQRILDIGTGTGIWAIDMGDEHPAAEVTGVDLSPIQPAWVPPNVQFLVENAEEPWLCDDATLDFVHLRNMSMAIKDFPALFRQAFRALKPGGWIELPEFRWEYGCDDDSLRDDYTPPQMIGHIREALAHFHVDIHASRDNPFRLRDAGFVDIRHSVLKVPVGPWPRDPHLKLIGLYIRSIIYDGLQAITLGPFTRGLHWTPDEVEQFLVRVRRDLLDASVHVYVYFHSLCAQKPL